MLVTEDPRSLSEHQQQPMPQVNQEFKLYKRRLWMLLLFSTCSLLNAMQWIQYSVIEDILIEYYNISRFELNWTSLVYYMAYIPFFYPVTLFLHRFGMRTTLLAGSFLTCLSTILQCFSQERDGYYLALISQTIASIGQVFILPLPPKLAAVWFGPGEVCRATSIGTFGNQLGVALGFLFTPMMMPSDPKNLYLVKEGRSIVAYTLTAFDLAVFLLLLLTFQEKPPKPPSRGEAFKPEDEEDVCYWMKIVMKNRNFVLLTASYGLLCGVVFGIGPVLNQLVGAYHKNATKEIGWLGWSVIVAGLAGSLVAGYILDRTHKFKETSLAAFCLSLLSLIAFMGCLYMKEIWPLFITIIILGFFLACYVPVGFEYAVEITYPAPEGTTAGILNTSIMVFGIPAVMIPSYLVEKVGIYAGGAFFSSWIICGIVCVACIKAELLRSKQNRRADAATVRNVQVTIDDLVQKVANDPSSLHKVANDPSSLQKVANDPSSLQKVANDQSSLQKVANDQSSLQKDSNHPV